MSPLSQVYSLEYIVHELGEVLSRVAIDFKKTANEACIVVSRILRADICDMFIWNPALDPPCLELYAVAIEGKSHEVPVLKKYDAIMHYHSYEMEASITGRVINSHIPIFSNDLQVDDRRSIKATEKYEKRFGERLQNLLVCPMWHRDTFVGALRIMNKRSGLRDKDGYNFFGDITKQDQLLMQVIADILSAAIAIHFYERAAVLGSKENIIAHNISGDIIDLQLYVEDLLKKTPANMKDILKIAQQINDIAQSASEQIGIANRLTKGEPKKDTIEVSGLLKGISEEYKTTTLLSKEISVNFKSTGKVNVTFDKEMLSAIAHILLSNAENAFDHIKEKEQDKMVKHDYQIVVNVSKEEIGVESNACKFSNFIVNKEFVAFIMRQIKSDSGHGYGLIMAEKMCRLNDAELILENREPNWAIAKVRFRK